MPATADLVAVAWLGLATAGTAAIARALAPAGWKKRKPWDCAVCLSVWSGLIVADARGLAGLIVPEPTAAWVVGWGLDYLAAVALSVLLLSLTVLHPAASSVSVLDP